ncbi:MAG TPA: riboflavin synthase [Acidimicrobiales bacterium]|nr:riboflavin synthase [Acidimicrobiales bacterium]
MFTGIVEEMGALSAREDSPGAPGGTRLVFSAGLVTEGTSVGDSISVNGCCLTVVDMGPGWWAADAVAETLSRTNLGALRTGDPVNLERAVSLNARLGGHLVQGHVDGTGRVLSPAPDLEIEAPEQVRRYLVEKGSVTVDGVSLTVVSVTPAGFTVAVIPHTMAVTTLGRRQAGDTVNLEADVMAKYAEQLLAAGSPSPYREL